MHFLGNLRGECHKSRHSQLLVLESLETFVEKNLYHCGFYFCQKTGRCIWIYSSLHDCTLSHVSVLIDISLKYMAAKIGRTFCTAPPFSIVGWLCTVVTLDQHWGPHSRIHQATYLVMVRGLPFACRLFFSGSMLSGFAFQMPTSKIAIGYRPLWDFRPLFDGSLQMWCWLLQMRLFLKCTLNLMLSAHKCS